MAVCHVVLAGDEAKEIQSVPKVPYDPFDVSVEDAFRIVVEYEDLRIKHRGDPKGQTYYPLSDLPADKRTLRRALQFVYRQQSSMLDDNALAFQDAYQYAAFFIDDRISDAANWQAKASPEQRRQRLRSELQRDDPVRSLNIAELLLEVTLEADNLLLEWRSFVESLERSKG